MSDSSDYKKLSGSSYDGIVVFDESDSPDGDNSNGLVEVYGNVVINRDIGIKAFNGDGLAEVRIYNNTVIDSEGANYSIENADEFLSGYLYNNLSYMEDRNNATHARWNSGSARNWIVSNNHFYGGGVADCDNDYQVASNWTSNCVNGDPKLPGGDWTNRSGTNYYKSIKFSDVIPSEPSLFSAGKKLENSHSSIVLTYGTDFNTLPEIGTFNRTSLINSNDIAIGAIGMGDSYLNQTTGLNPPTGLKIQNSN
jgi:hypothetical protein